MNICSKKDAKKYLAFVTLTDNIMASTCAIILYENRLLTSHFTWLVAYYYKI